MILKKDLEYILSYFYIYTEIYKIEILQRCEIQRQKRYIYKIETIDKKQWVCRISNEIKYTQSLINQQSSFAMFLWFNGMITPYKLLSKEGYCAKIYIDNELYNVTLEEYLGNDITEVSLSLFYEMGKILGKMHKLSPEFYMKINYSTVSKAIQTKEASFDKILKKLNRQIKDNYLIDNIAKLHNNLILELSDAWCLLPHGAVHGDLGIFNNMVETRNGIGIIDFNLAGDEVYLGDVLASFYSSIHKYDWADKINKIDLDKALNYFFKAYGAERRFQDLEKKYYSKVAALFDGIFYCKSLIDKCNKNEDLNTLEQWEKAIDLFDESNHKMIEL